MAAWDDGQAWLDEILTQLRANRDWLAGIVAKEMPGVVMRLPEATYLAWLDFRDYDLSQSPGEFVGEQANVVVIDGPECGTGGAGFLRLNFATPRPVLTEIVQRIASTGLPKKMRLSVDQAKNFTIEFSD